MIGAILLLISGNSFAGGSKDESIDIDVDNSTYAPDHSTTNTNNEANAGAESSATTGDNSVVISERHPDNIKIRNVASPDTPNPYPTAPCRVGVAAGLSLAGGALSGGGSVEDKECTLRETARSFKDLGVPEVGLYLLCTQSAVINGRVDKKGELEENQPDPLGATECLRLVREFQGDTDGDSAGGAVAVELQELRESQDRVERQFIAKVEQLEEQISKPERLPAPVVKKEVIQQPYLTQDKRSKLAAVLEEEITKSGDDDE